MSVKDVPARVTSNTDKLQATHTACTYGLLSIAARRFALSQKESPSQQRIAFLRYKVEKLSCAVFSERWMIANILLEVMVVNNSADNAFVEAFNGRFRAECLNAPWFLSLADAREKLEDWRKYYDEERPHGAIGNRPPILLQNHVGATSPPT